MRVMCSATRALAATPSACSSRMMAASSGASTRSGTVGGAVTGGDACRRVIGSCRGRAGGGALAGTLGGDMLSEAGPVDVDPNGMHGEAVEDGGGERGVAQEAAPVAERDIRSDGRGDLAMATVDEVVEGVSGGRLVAAFLGWPETAVKDEELCGARTGLEPARVRAVGEARVEV